MGTPEFAVPSLRALAETYEVVGVFCQPDRPKGRGHKLAACPVKEEALRLGIPVFQPERIRQSEGVEALRALAPDLCVTAAFGQILSKEILDIPRHGTINVHASLLPKHRGSAPVHHSIILGDAQTGVTTMMTDVGMDTGDILLKASTPIRPDDTAGTMTEKLSLLGAELLMETIVLLRNGTLTPEPQDAARASYEPKLTRETGRIHWRMTRAQIDRLVRGTDPWPGAYTQVGDQMMKVFSVKDAGPSGTAPGTVLHSTAKTGLVVACGDGAIEILELQMPGQKRMRADAYLLGHTIDQGTILGEREDA